MKYTALFFFLLAVPSFGSSFGSSTVNQLTVTSATTAAGVSSSNSVVITATGATGLAATSLSSTDGLAHAAMEYIYNSVVGGTVGTLIISDTSGNSVSLMPDSDGVSLYVPNGVNSDSIQSYNGMNSLDNTLEAGTSGNGGVVGTWSIGSSLILYGNASGNSPDLEGSNWTNTHAGLFDVQSLSAASGSLGTIVFTGTSATGNIVAASLVAASGTHGVLASSSNGAMYLTSPVINLYVPGSSYDRGYENGGSQLPNGGLSGNYFDLFQHSPIMQGHGTVYNASVNGETSGSARSLFAAGNSLYGVTVPSGPAVATFTSGSGGILIGVIPGSLAYNDAYNSISTATTVANMIALSNSFHAIGAKVIVQTSPIIPASFVATGGTSKVALLEATNAAIASGTVPADFPVMRMENWLSNQQDSVTYNGDYQHPTAQGHIDLAVNLEAWWVAAGWVANANYEYHSTPDTFLNGLTVDGYNGGSLNVNTSINMGSTQGYLDVYNGPGFPNLAIAGLFAATGDSFEQYADSQADANFKWGSMLSPTSRVFTTWATMTGGTTSLSGTFTANTVAATTGSIGSIASTSGTVSGVETIGGLLTLNNGLTFGSNNQPIYIYNPGGYIVGMAAVAGNSFLIFGGSNSASTIDLGISTSGSTLSTTYLALSSTGATFAVNGTISTPGVIVDSGETVNGNLAVSGDLTSVTVLAGTLTSGTAGITNSALYLRHPIVVDTDSGSVTNLGALAVSVSGSTATVKSSNVSDTSTFYLIVGPW